jgi:hypothetical protein
MATSSNGLPTIHLQRATKAPGSNDPGVFFLALISIFRIVLFHETPAGPLFNRQYFRIMELLGSAAARCGQWCRVL